MRAAGLQRTRGNRLSHRPDHPAGKGVVAQRTPDNARRCAIGGRRVRQKCVLHGLNALGEALCLEPDRTALDGEPVLVGFRVSQTRRQARDLLGVQEFISGRHGGNDATPRGATATAGRLPIRVDGVGSCVLEGLTRLAEGEATVSELADPFPMSLPAISRHLKMLERAGLIVRNREAQWRPSRLQVDPLDEAVEWMQSRKQTWEARMDRPRSALRQKEIKDE